MTILCDEAVGVGADSRRRSSQLHRVAGGMTTGRARKDMGDVAPLLEGGGDPF